MERRGERTVESGQHSAAELSAAELEAVSAGTDSSAGSRRAATGSVEPTGAGADHLLGHRTYTLTVSAPD